MKPLLIIITFLLIFSSCTDKDDTEIFENSPSQRISESAQALKEKLKANPNGWRFVYKPSEGETGYFVFHFKFIDDNFVEMASDFSANDLDFKRSEYQITVGSTVKLSFSTFSALHKLSDSGYSPIPGQAGQGLKGDFEFLFFEDKDGILEFKTNRRNQSVFFVPAESNSFDDIKGAYKRFEKFTFRLDSVENAANVAITPFLRPFIALKLNDIEEKDFEIEVNNNTRIISLLNKESGEVKSSSAYGYSSQGGSATIFVESLSVKDEVFNNALFGISSNGEKITTVNDNSKSLSISLGTKETSKTDFKTFMDIKQTRFGFILYGDVRFPRLPNLYSNAFTELMGDLGKKSINTIVVTPIDGGGLLIEIYGAGVTGGIYAELFEVSVPPTDDRIIVERSAIDLTILGYQPLDPAKSEVVNEFLQFFVSPNGLYVENLGDQSGKRNPLSSSPFYNNSAFRFTSVSNPELTCTLLQFSRN